MVLQSFCLGSNFQMPISIRPLNSFSVAACHFSASEFMTSQKEFGTSWNKCIIDDNGWVSVVPRVLMTCPVSSHGHNEYWDVGAVPTSGKFNLDPPGGTGGKTGGWGGWATSAGSLGLVRLVGVDEGVTMTMSGPPSVLSARFLIMCWCACPILLCHMVQSHDTVVITTSITPLVDLASSKSKLCNLLPCSSPTIKGIPFWEIVVPHLVVLHLSSIFVAEINEKSCLLTFRMYRTFLISMLNFVLLGNSECSITFPCPLMVMNFPSAISATPGGLNSQ